MATDEWRDIVGYEGLYQISKQGQVKRLERAATDGRLIREKILNRRISPSGYYRVNMRKNGGRKCHLVHRLVPEAFIPNPGTKPFINHIDGDKLNSVVENLEWVTPKENVDHAISVGLMKEIPPCSLQGESNPRHKITRKMAEKIRELYASGNYTLKQIADMYCVDKCTVWDIKENRTWMKGDGIYVG